ncbi:MAG: hypothetical protein MUO43_12520 [Desulfobacterales bacterium]|nr:hypothetical protein [Desulfobacterales bacterium]
MNAESGLSMMISWLIGLDDMTRISVLALFFVVTYFALLWFVLEDNKLLAMGISYIITILILDLIVSFGTYTFNLLYFTYTVDKGFLTLSLITYILQFGFWQQFGLSVFNGFNGAVTLSTYQTAFVWMLTFGDNLLEFSLLFWILKDVFSDISDALLWSVIPVTVYAVLTNPWLEYDRASLTLQHITHFFGTATQGDQLLVIGTIAISFILVVYLLSIATTLFFGIGKSTVQPGWESKSWEFSYIGSSFLLALIYSISVLLHPHITFWVTIPLIIGLSILKSSVKSYAGKRKDERNNRKMIEESVRGIQ